MSQAPDDDTVIVALPRETLARLVTLASLFQPLAMLASIADRLRRLARFADPLVTFITNPVRFIWGAIILGILMMIQETVLGVLEFINLLFTGEAGTPGIADLPLFIVNAVIDGFATGGDAVLEMLAFVRGEIFTAAQAAGPFAPLVAVLLWGTFGVVMAVVLWRVLLAVATALNLDAVIALLTGDT